MMYDPTIKQWLEAKISKIEKEKKADEKQNNGKRKEYFNTMINKYKTELNEHIENGTEKNKSYLYH